LPVIPGARHAFEVRGPVCPQLYQRHDLEAA
jgi:hypothetical protein